MIVDEVLVISSSSNIRKGRGYVRSHASARVASTRRIITRQATTKACNVKYGNDNGNQEDDDIDNAIVD